MENPLVVFISSVISGMGAERQAAEAAIQAIPLSRAWRFESSPASSLPLAESYLSKVRECDIFVLLLGDKVTDPVKAEAQTALEAGKARLVFLSDGAPADVVSYAQALGVKYASYRDAADLATKVAEAVGDELITGYRRYRMAPADLGALGDFLGRLAEGVVQIGGGVQVGSDQTVQGDVVVGTKVERQIGTGGGMYVEGDISTDGGGVVGRDKIDDSTVVAPGGDIRASGHVIVAGQGATVVIGETPVVMTAVDRNTALGRYLHHIISYNRYLQLQGIRSGGRLVSIELDRIYVRLRATRAARGRG